LFLFLLLLFHSSLSFGQGDYPPIRILQGYVTKAVELKALPSAYGAEVRFILWGLAFLWGLVLL